MYRYPFWHIILYKTFMYVFCIHWDTLDQIRPDNWVELYKIHNILSFFRSKKHVAKFRFAKLCCCLIYFFLDCFRKMLEKQPLMKKTTQIPPLLVLDVWSQMRFWCSSITLKLLVVAQELSEFPQRSHS